MCNHRRFRVGYAFETTSLTQSSTEARLFSEIARLPYWALKVTPAHASVTLQFYREERERSRMPGSVLPGLSLGGAEARGNVRALAAPSQGNHSNFAA